MAANRALIVIRLSKVTDATTSPERQEAEIRKFCELRGMDVIGVATDLNVSAGLTSPFERPQLRSWLNDRTGEYDTIVFYRTDRLCRRITHMSRMIEWAKSNGKNLVSATEPFDLSTAMGEAMATMLAMFGQMELDAISERNSGAAEYNIRAGRYRGGLAPAGYRKAKNDDTGYGLIPDEEGLAPVLRDVVQRIIAGEALSGIVRDLNSRKVQTQKDRQAELEGNPVAKPREWSYDSLRRVLTSPSLIGQATMREVEKDDNGKPRKVNDRKVYGPESIIFGDDGLPLQRAEPLISAADFRALQAILSGGSKYAPKSKKTSEAYALTQVLFCTCGEPMYRVGGFNGRKPRYRCISSTKGQSCGGGSVTMEEAESAVNDLMIQVYGNLPAVRGEYVVGSNNSETIREIDAKLDSLADAVTRFPVESSAYRSLITQVETLGAQREALAAEPITESGWKYVPTGETFAVMWEGMNSTERNGFLREFGVRVTAHKRTGEETDYHFNGAEFLFDAIKGVNPEVYENALSAGVFSVEGTD